MKATIRGSRQTIECNPDFTHKGWKHVSQEAKDFVSRMKGIVITRAEILVKDKSKRLTVTQILEHPWLTKNCEVMRELRLGANKGARFGLYTQQQYAPPASVPLRRRGVMD